MVGRLHADGREVVLMSCHPSDDRHIFEIMRSAGLPELRYVAGYDEVGAAMDLLGSAGLVVAERLHGSVLAAAAATPFVAVEYRPKVSDFAASVGIEAHVVRADAVSGASLADAITRMENNRSEVVEAMESHVATYRTRLGEASDRLKSALS